MIRIRNLHVRYNTDQGTVHAVCGIDIDVEQGQFYTLLGLSGCGKTTTLSIDGEPVYSSAQNRFVPPHKRPIGMVFQSYAIWPHMTVPERRLPAAGGTSAPAQERDPGPRGEGAGARPVDPAGDVRPRLPRPGAVSRRIV